MKANLLLTAVGIGVLLVVHSSCDTSEEPAKPKPDALALQALNATNIQTQTQRFTLNASTGGRVNGTGGTIIEFPANAFLNSTNVAVTGNVEIELIEIYTRSSMLLTQKATVGKRSNGTKEMLVSGGEFYVNATKDGNTLKPSKGYSIIVPANNTGGANDAMNLFNGVEECMNDLCNLVWEEQDANRGIEVGEFQEQGGVYPAYYAFQIKFGWTNIDRWYSDPRPKTTLFIEVPEGYDNTNCAVFIAYSGEPAALGRFDKFDETTRMFTEHYGLVPIGLNVHIILVSILEDELVYAIKSATVAANQVVVIDKVNSSTQEELIKLIDDLP